MINDTTTLFSIIVLTGFVVFGCMDAFTTHSTLAYRSYKTNLQLFAVNSMIMSLFTSIVVLNYSTPGLLTNISNPIWKTILSFLILDLVLYYWHKLCHDHDILWMFHRVHHNDLHMNVSTSFRLHFLELIFTNLIKSVVIITTGIDQCMAIINEGITTLFVMFHHSNISVKHERLFGQLFVVPSFHRIHHSVNREEHDSNYGAIFSIWDRMFNTVTESTDVQVGIKTPSPQTTFDLIAFGMTPISKPILEPIQEQTIPQFMVSIDEMIATAAYYRAEKRGFQHGDDQHDWFEAQQEINQLIKQQCAA